MPTTIIPDATEKWRNKWAALKQIIAAQKKINYATVKSLNKEIRVRDARIEHLEQGYETVARAALSFQRELEKLKCPK